MIITPKHLARELNVDKHVVRAMLRTRFGKVYAKDGKGHRWEWDDEKEAEKIRRWLAKALGKEIKPNGGGK